MSDFACFLPNEAMIHLRGNKIPEFLQGQLTCDTRRLSNSTAVAGALCNVKGRVLSDLVVLQLSDSHVILRLRQSLAAKVAETLQRYAQFSRITVDLDARDHAIMGVREEQESPASEQPPVNGLSVSLNAGTLSLQRGLGYGELISVDPQSPSDLESLVADRSQETEARWMMETLRSGHYALELEDHEAFTPQALNYDLTDLVAFDKGCYTGQEIVARLHYKGRSKRRLQIFEARDAVSTIARDTPLFSIEGNPVGRCLRFESAPNALPLLAAEVQSDHLHAVLHLKIGEQLQEPQQLQQLQEPQELQPLNVGNAQSA